VRLTSWLLWLSAHSRSPLWRCYCNAMPGLQDVTLLLSYTPQEAQELQEAALIVCGAPVQLP
jgi:hypothetical protein